MLLLSLFVMTVTDLLMGAGAGNSLGGRKQLYCGRHKTNDDLPPRATTRRNCQSKRKGCLGVIIRENQTKTPRKEEARALSRSIAWVLSTSCSWLPVGSILHWPIGAGRQAQVNSKQPAVTLSTPRHGGA